MSEKHALVSARLKKPNLNPNDLNSYRPISNLSFTSKLVERAVAARFVAHCELNGLLPLPAKQSAYRRHHSTETAVLAVYCRGLTDWIVSSLAPLYWQLIRPC